MDELKEKILAGIYMWNIGMSIIDSMFETIDKEGYKIVKKDSNFQSSLVEEMEDLGMIKEEE